MEGGIQSLGFARRAAFTHRNSAVGKFLICDLIIGLVGSESRSPTRRSDGWECNKLCTDEHVYGGVLDDVEARCAWK